jgi:parallel beta-helix repeat protein
MIDSGVFIGGRKLEYWNTHTIDSTNTLNGKPVLYWKNQTSGIIPAGVGQVILGNCSNVTVQNLEFENCSIGIELGYSTNISIINNSIKDSLGGIFVSISDNCEIIKNTAVSNFMYGLYLYYSNKSIVSGNDIFDNEYGIRVWFSHNNSLTSNNISRNDYGLFCLQSEYNNYTHCNISRNLDGIDILACNNNNISNNTVFSNRNWGIFISGSLSNIIYHNNFINNANQAFDDGSNQWDDGYPSGGNYWSDFDEPDEGAYDDYRGIDQDIVGGDGIVDNGTGAGGGKKPYVIDTDSQDVYPFIKSYGNYTYLYEGWNLISLPTIQPDTNLGIVLKSIEGDYDAVQWFNTSDESDPWKHNHTSKPHHLNDLNVLNHTIGFWIHIINPGGVLFKSPGNPPTTPQQIPIYPGWNLVGYPSKSNKPRDTALNNINFAIDVDSLWSYDAEDRSWIEIGASENLTVGSGYWIHSIASGMLLWDVPL